jgi:hypothetical protein
MIKFKETHGGKTPDIPYEQTYKWIIVYLDGNKFDPDKELTKKKG